MDKLRILSAGARPEMPLFHQADPQRRSPMPGSQGKVTNDPGPVNSAAQDEHIQWSGA